MQSDETGNVIIATLERGMKSAEIVEPRSPGEVDGVPYQSGNKRATKVE
jgi:hypothetical protein